MSDAWKSYLEETFPGATETGELMLVPNLSEGDSPENLVTKAYGKMCRMELDVPLLIPNDIYLQRILRSHARNISKTGHSEVPSVQSWIKQCEKGIWVDEVLLNAGIAALDTGVECIIMRNVSATLVQTYVEHFHMGTLGQLLIAGYCQKVVKHVFGGAHCKTGFIPLCIDKHWGFILLQSANASCISEAATVSWGDSFNLRPDMLVLSGVIALLRTVFPNGSFLPISQNYFGSVLGWEPQQDWWSCGLYVLAVMRLFASESDFIPAGTIQMYDNGKLERIRHGCEKAMWFAILTNLHLFGEDLMPDTIQCHIYGGLCITKDLSRFVDCCVMIRQFVWELDERNRCPPAANPIVGTTETVLFHVEKKEDGDFSEIQRAGDNRGIETVQTQGQGTGSNVQHDDNAQESLSGEAGHVVSFTTRDAYDSRVCPLLDQHGQSMQIDFHEEQCVPFRMEIPELITEEKMMEQFRDRSAEEKNEEECRCYECMSTR